MVKAYKYIYEGYDDPIHRYGHFKGTKYFIPEPYNLGIFELNRKIQYIKKQDQIDNFQNDLFGFNPTINEIDMDEELVNTINENYKIQEKMLNDRDPFIDGFDKFKTDEQIGVELFKFALDCLERKQYDKSIESNQIIIRKYPHIELIPSCYYNIACAYAYLKNEDKLYEYLNMCIDHGYIGWAHMVNDLDLRPYKNDIRFVKIIQKCVNKDDKVKETIKTIPYPVKEYIERHKIDLNSISI